MVAAFRRRAISWLTGRAANLGLLAGTLSLIAYGTVLWAQTRAPLAEVAAIRETSVVFAALIGMRLFAECFGTQASRRSLPGCGGHRADQRLRRVASQVLPFQRARRMSTRPGAPRTPGRIGVPSSR
jgi:hypothetical protein